MTAAMMAEDRFIADYLIETPLARMYREAPVNSIWEGSGNVMCLDVLRALEREAEVGALLLDDLQQATAGHPLLSAQLSELRDLLVLPQEQREMQARRLVQKLVLLIQAILMLQHAPQTSAEAFISSRFDAGNGRVFGTLGAAGIAPAGSIQEEILRRAWPL